ncbi:RNA-DNA hybrid ribonuclease [Saccharomycopsis crataegensis]|uniref:Ribonuclease H n=1 Tax=Saccharomycopsis crataegensis TaxID=43959 RepID=A0AAV5QQ81_9ASCO|nr:RNA-DNA hybrid ribonuclease [Saccharomycopsis crataegensis]
MGKKYYAIANGRSNGVFNDWGSAKEQVHGYSNAVYKSFNTEAEARSFVSSNSGGESSNYGSGGGSSSYGSGSGGSTSYSPSYNSGGYGSSRSSYYSNTTIKAATKTSPSVNSYTGSSSVVYSASSSSYSSRKGTSKVTKDVYVDGSSRNNGKPNAKAGYGVYWNDNDPKNYHAPLKGPVQTNQRAELQALRHATDSILDDIRAGNGSSYNVHTDSQYTKKAVTEWKDKWERNGWKTSTGTPVANSDLIKPIISNIKEINNEGSIKISYVPGHKGIYGNEMADALANKGADKHPQ